MKMKMKLWGSSKAAGGKTSSSTGGKEEGGDSQLTLAEKLEFEVQNS